MDDASARDWLNQTLFQINQINHDTGFSFADDVANFIKTGLIEEGLDCFIPLADKDVQFVFAVYVIGFAHGLAKHYSIDGNASKLCAALAISEQKLFSEKPEQEVIDIVLKTPSQNSKKFDSIAPCFLLGQIASHIWHIKRRTGSKSYAWRHFLSLIRRSVRQYDIAEMLNHEHKKTNHGFDNLFNKNPGLFISLVEKHYPLTPKYLQRLVSDHIYLDWENISSNTSITWNIGDIDACSDLINWECFSKNSSVFWNTEMTLRFSDRIDWKSFSGYANTEWSIDKLRLFEELIYWKGLSFNRRIKWTNEIINSFGDRLNYFELSSNPSFPWDIDLIERFREKLSFSELSSNTGIPWNNKFIENFYHDLDFHNLCSNPSVSWELINTLGSDIDWKAVSINPGIPWSEKFIAEYSSLLDWGGISSNRGIEWTPEFIKKNAKRINWNALSTNPSVPWSFELMKEYKSKIMWTSKSFGGLTNKFPNTAMISNEGVVWTPEMIEAFAPTSKLQEYISNRFDFGISSLPFNQIDLRIRKA